MSENQGASAEQVEEIKFHEYHSTINGQRFIFPDGQEATFYGGFLTLRSDLMYTEIDKNGKEEQKPCYTYLDKIIGKQAHITKLISGQRTGKLEELPDVEIKGVTKQGVANADASLARSGLKTQEQEDITTGPDADIQKAFKKAADDSLSEAELKSAELTQNPAAARAAERIAAIQAERASRTQDIPGKQQ